MVAGEKKKKKKMETWQMVREIYWCEKNNKNKWHMYLLTGDIKLVCTLSFTFKSNCGINLKTLLECMNSQYFFPFYTKIKNKKVKFQMLIFFVIVVWLDDFPISLCSFQLFCFWKLFRYWTFKFFYDSLKLRFGNYENFVLAQGFF